MCAGLHAISWFLPRHIALEYCHKRDFNSPGSPVTFFLKLIRACSCYKSKYHYPNGLGARKYVVSVSPCGGHRCQCSLPSVPPIPQTEVLPYLIPTRTSRESPIWKSLSDTLVAAVEVFSRLVQDLWSVQTIYAPAYVTRSS